MYYYLIFNNLTYDSNHFIELKEVISNYYGLIIETKIFDQSNFVLCIKEFNNSTDLQEYINNFIMDNLVKFQVFQSNKYDSIDEMKDDIKLNNEMLKKVSLNSKDFYFKSKELTHQYLKNDVNITLRKNILKEYYNDLEMIRTIEVLIDSNLNTVLASKRLNVHRNTLNYRINKFYEVTGYDLKVLNDVFIIKKIL